MPALQIARANVVNRDLKAKIPSSGTVLGVRELRKGKSFSQTPFLRQKGHPGKGLCLQHYLPCPRSCIPLQSLSVQLREGCVSRRRRSSREACVVHLFSLLSLRLEGVCTYRKPFLDIAPVGEADNKERVQGKI